MSAEQLAAASGLLLSLGLAYIPGLESRYKALDSKTQSLFMLSLLALATFALFGVSCTGARADFTCDGAACIAPATLFWNALVTNQATYLTLVRPFAKKS